MEFTFLGTSSGVPTKQRNVSGLAMQCGSGKNWILVDCGEGTQQQILNTRFSLTQLEAICITHIHGDHCYGLPGLLASAGMTGRKAALTIIAPKAIFDFLSGVIETTQLQLPYEIETIEVETLIGQENPSWRGVDLAVAPTAMSHRVPSYGYSFVECNVSRKLDIDKLRSLGVPAGPVWGQIQQGVDVVLDNGDHLIANDFLFESNKPRKVIVGGDNDQPDLFKNEAIDADVLIHEATYTEEVAKVIGSYPQHSTAKSVAQFAESNEVANLVLTHFSSRYQADSDTGSSISEIEEEAKLVYRGNLSLANDFDRFVLSRSGELKQVLEEASDGK